MGSSTQKTTQTAIGPGKDALAAAGPGRIEDQYQADVANPNRLAPQAQQYAGNVLSGQYLDPTTNPSYGALVKSISDPVTANISGMFSRAGRGTSASASGLGGALATGLSAGLAQPLFGAFNQERTNQQQAATMAPALDAVQSLPLEQYLERSKGLATLDQQGKTTSTPSGLSMALAAIMGLGSLGGKGGPFAAGGVFGA